MLVRLRAWIGLVSLPIALLTLGPFASAQTVWSGLSFTFTKVDDTDATLSANQDRITNNVWITRSSFGMGLVNAASECDLAAGCTYTHSSSPADTEWATAAMLANSDETIAATNWQNLTFTDWEDAYQNQVGAYILNPSYRDAVVHLISDDIYLDLRFTAWSQHGGGGFSYVRAIAGSAPSPTGDYNHDGVVDAADYVAWRSTLGQSAAPAGNGADGNANGTIDAGDYQFWRGKFGNAAPGSGASLGSAQVPEPASVTLQLFALILCLRRTTTNRRSVAISKCLNARLLELG